MNGWTTAVVSYVIAIVISFFVAGVIQLMVAVLSGFSKPEASAQDTVMNGEHVETVRDNDAAVAAVIAIAKRR